MKIVEYTELGKFEELSSFAFKVWREHYVKIIGEKQVEYMINKFQNSKYMHNQFENEGYIYYVAKTDKGEIIGYCSIRMIEPDTMFLSKLYIEKLHRKEGIGKTLLNHAIKKNRANDSKFTVRLTVNKNNEDSIEAYKKMGFKTISEQVVEIGDGFVMDDYVMEMSQS